MKFNIKKTVASLLLTSMIFSTACSSVPEEAPELLGFFNTDSASVIAMIDALPEASLESEAQIEAAYVAYSALETDARNEVTNYNKLKTLRDEIADLYETERIGEKIDRSKILIGSYFGTFDLDNIEESDVQDIVDCGIDFMTGTHKFGCFDLLAEYGLGIFTHINYHKWPYWRGDQGSRKVGEPAPNPPTFDMEYFASQLPEHSEVDHEALWGIWIVDEPNINDVWFNEEQRVIMQEKYPNILAYINLYPNCGYGRLGVANSTRYNEYKEYIDRYVEIVKSSYICYDRYMYEDKGGNLNDMITDTSIIAKACRENDREFWMWLQVNFPVDDGRCLSVDQIKFQANLAMSFGVTSMIWGCWHPGWWYMNVLDSEGNKTEQYEKLKEVNAETNILSPVIIKYNSIDNSIIGCKHPEVADFYIYDDNTIDQDTFVDVSMGENTTNSVLCGYFEKKIGDGEAMMFVNITDPDCETKNSAQVFFKVSDSESIVTEHTAAGSYVLTPDEDGYYKISVENAEYSFVTVE